MEGLTELPAVGNYASAATMSLHKGDRAVIIDANSVRIASRLIGQPYDGETRRKRWLVELLESLTPSTDCRKFNYALLDLGALICRPKAPKCSECPLNLECLTGQDGAHC